MRAQQPLELVSHQGRATQDAYRNVYTYVVQSLS